MLFDIIIERLNCLSLRSTVFQQILHTTLLYVLIVFTEVGLELSTGF